MKTLSIVMCARNDAYMGNYLYRLGTAISYLSRNVGYAERSASVEILVTDWNSDVPLANELPLTAEAGALTRFVCVPPALARGLQQPDQVFHNSMANNTALRRAAGQFVMFTDADALIPLHSLNSLFSVLEGRTHLPINLTQTFFIADRRHVPWEVVQRQPTLDGWDEYLLTHGGDLPVDRGSPGLGICQNAWMAHRDIWHACRGLDEQLHYWGWTDAELMIRINQRHASIQLSGLGVSIFHMEHWPRNRRSTPSRRNPHVVAKTFAANNAGWGLGDHSLDILPPANPPAQTPGPPSLRPPSRGAGLTLDTLKKWRRDREVRRVVKDAGRTYRGAKLERTALELLAGCAMTHEARVSLEFGASIGRCSTAIVARLNPSADIYAIDDWGVKKERSCQPNEFADVLRDAGSVGQLRFIAGDLQTALQRLESSFPGQFEVDLAMFRERLFSKGALGVLTAVLHRLSPAGAVICVSENPQFQQELRLAMQRDQGHLALMEVDRVTWMICRPA
jgi:hypothetical protein